MKSKTKQIKWPLALVIFGLLFYLLFANQIVLNLFVNENKAVKINNTDSISSTSDFYFALDGSTYYESLFEYFEISGYAVCEADYEDKESKKIDLIFRSDNASYKVPTALISRGDIKLSFKDCITQGNMLGFKSYFSTLNIKNGIYELYLYDVENKDSYAYENTGRYFKKDGKVFAEYIPEPQEASIEGIGNENSDTLNYYMNDVTINSNNKIFIDGWGYLPDVSSRESDVFLSVIDGENIHYYKVQTYSSTGVAYTFNNDNYNWCRFQAEFDPDKFESKELIFGLVIINGNNVGVNLGIKNYEIQGD